MECMKDGCKTELTGKQVSFCSDKCRKAQSRTDEALKSDKYLKDATGKLHKIDFTGRRKDKLLLKSWLDGEGTPYQQALAETDFSYSIINGFWDKDGNITDQGRTYLGGECEGLEHINPPFATAGIASEASV